MRAFAYRRAETVEDAVAARAAGARLLAGGTEILNWMRLGIEEPDSVVDVSRLSDLRGIAVRDGGLRIGALATLNEIEASPAVREAAPVLSRACLKAASAQLRNLATIGGNVLQKTRCPYFRAEAPGVQPMPWPCNKRDPGSGCAATDGAYGRAALFGWTGDCVANQPSDPAVALAALDATVEIVGPHGARRVAMVDFHLTQREAEDLAGGPEAEAILGAPPSGDRSHVLLENRLRADEMIVGYAVPLDAAAARSAYLKVRERESYEYALVSAAVCLDLDGGTVRSARIALGSVAQKPWRLTAAERALAGVPLTEAALAPVLDDAMSGARALPGQDYKIALARNAALRALMTAGGRIDG